MAKSKNKRDKTAHKSTTDSTFKSSDQGAFDPTLSSLFATSLGPVVAPPKSRYPSAPANPAQDGVDEEVDDEVLSSASEQQDSDASGDDEDEDEDGDVELEDASEDASVSEGSESDREAALAQVRGSALNGAQDRPSKKRKRGTENEVEDVYLRKLAREEQKEEEARTKKLKTQQAKEATDNPEQPEDASDDDEPAYEIPKHETQIAAESKDKDELEKAARTVFLGNVSSEAVTSKSAKKTLMHHLASFIPDLADTIPPHKVESIRFRSTAFASALPKKAAFAKKEIMDATTKSTNAYAVYSTQLAAREAVKRLNGTMVLRRHLQVDSVAHPTAVDHRRCVFVGNLAFVDDESGVRAEGEEPRKKKATGDVEEGLWVQFSKAGKVQSVRVVRDAKTRVGKGFAYVQFEDENGVEAALQFDDQKYPPLLPRKLRVVRAKAMKKKKDDKKPDKPATTSKPKGAYNAKVTEEQKTQQGRARAMLGKAGAFRSAESFVFEGHRASSKQGHSGLKLGGKKKGGKSSGKPKTRSSKRAAAWKASGGRK